MRTLTDEQRHAVDRRQGTLLLAAGAGSGKTSVLVERFVAAVTQDGVPPGRILAISFTDRAAGELRERVRARFLELGWRDAARDTEGAHIGTVHGFCARLLRAHALVAGLDPRFSVLAEPRAARLRELAFRRALAAFVSGPGAEQAVDLVAAYGPDRLRTAILAVHEELRSRGHRRPRLPALPSEPAADQPGGGAPTGPRTTALAEAIADAQRELAACTPTARRVHDALDVLQRAGDRLGALGEGGRVPLPTALADLTLPPANGVLAGPACQTYRAALDALARACADDHGRRACRLLERLLDTYGAAYAQLKQDRAVVDFDDLELEARDLLERHPAVRSSWAQRFELLMVDEFQDTNPRQLALLQALDRDNLFTVGDEFQSIYGFRHADVGLFRRRRETLSRADAHLVLSRNFRGRRPVLEVINSVFGERFGSDFIALRAGRADDVVADPHVDADPAVELLLTDTRGWEEEGIPDVGGALPPATRWRQAEARMLAQRIAEMIAAGQARAGQTAVLVRATGDIPVYERALEERGLSTLAAGAGGYWSHQQVGDLLAYLGALANPLDEQALYGTLASPLVGLSSDGLALVARAAAPGDDRGGSGDASRPAVGVWPLLVRAFGGAGASSTPDAPAQDGAQSGARDLCDWLSPDDGRRLAEFVPRMLAERRLAPRQSIARLLESAVAASGYERHVLSLRWGARRLANVHKLLRLARRYEADEGRDLRGFLEHAERQAEAQAREADAPVEEEGVDAVRLMTIHAAKGLEFDVVAVADLGRQGRTDVPDLLIDGSRVGLRLVALDGSAPVAALDFDSLRRERLEREAGEEERVLYVAMTRARERLLLSGAANLERWPAPRPGAPPISWLGPALARDLPAELTPEDPIVVLHPSGDPRLRVRGWLNAPGTVGRVLAPTSLVAAAPAAATTSAPAPSTTPVTAIAPSAPTVAEGASTLSYTALAEYERCGYRYYLERSLGLPARAQDAPRDGGAAAPVASGGLSARLRGSLVHRLLESVDYAHPRPPDAQDIARVAGELGARPTESESGAIATLVSAVAETELGARLASCARVQREHPFVFSLGPGRPLINGVLDVIGHELDGGCLIVDYKSDVVGDGDLELLTEHHYAIQREVYALAALSGGALQVEIVHWYLERPREPVSAAFVAADAPSLAASLGERVAAVSAGRFAVTSRPHRDLCLGCPGRRTLCSYPEEMTLARPAP